MIYLVIRIFVYLLVALALGFAAGWLWRNREAAGRHGSLERALMETRSRLPQMESALRASDARLDAVMAELEAREEELAARHELLTAARRRGEELERACAALKARLQAAATETAPQTHRTDERPGEDGAPADERAERLRAELEDTLAATREALERTQRALAAEQRRVEELGRERELQKGALAALEQQLELARETRPRAANG